MSDQFRVEFNGYLRYKILFVEESCWGNAKVGFSMYGYENLASEYKNIELLDIADDEVIRKKVACSQGELMFQLNKTMVAAPFLVFVARPKVHCNTVMTAGIKNVVVGAVEGYKYRKGLHTKKTYMR